MPMDWLLPSGEEWVINPTVPGRPNKVMQRTGFAAADSWRAGGIQVNIRQVDSAEHGSVQRINAQHDVQYMWTNCIFTQVGWGLQELEPGHIKAADSQRTMTATANSGTMRPSISWLSNQNLWNKIQK
ncbi:MAG: hypothetical protein R2932_16160 [Caldilineaceae bacterium]